MNSMRLDLHKKDYLTEEEYKNYIYGSADVVGLMCLKVFVKGDQQQYDQLKGPAMSLGSAFQKVNFLRDLKADYEDLSRTYFPNTDLTQLDESSKQAIIKDIEGDFEEGLKGIKQLPLEARFGVFMAYRYYNKLLEKLKKTPALEIKSTRIRVPNYKKVELLTRSYVKYQLNLL
jgi:phytoene/squalene synthetase